MNRIGMAVPAFVVALLAFPSALSANTTYLQPDGDMQRTPGHAIILRYHTDAKPGQAISVVVRPIPAELYVALNDGGDRPAGLNAMPAVAIARSKKASTWDPWSREVDVAALPIGTYAVFAQTDGASAISALDVSTIGLVSAQTNQENVYMPTDLRSFRNVPGAALTFSTTDGSDRVPLYGGIARVSSARGHVIVRAGDGSIAVVGQQCCWDSAGDAGVVQSDRPVYRPGDLVRLRAILRHGNIEDYGIPSGPVNVQVTDPSGNTVVSRDLKVSPFGTIETSFRLPVDARLGAYHATIGSLTYDVYVAAYKKPEYEIDFTGTPHHAVGGTVIPVTVNARYFFGRPAGGMHVHYVAYSQPYWYARWWGPYASYVEGAGLWDGYDRKEIASGDAVTDGNGRAAFALDSKSVKWDESVNLEATARDASGRTVKLKSDVLITAAAFRVSAEPDTWFETAGQPVTLRLRANSYDDDRPIAGVAIRVQAHLSHWGGQKEIDDGTVPLDAVTNREGLASVVWTPQREGEVRFEVSAIDSQGRTSSSLSYLWVTGDSWEAPIYRPMLVPATEAVSPGKTAHVLLAVPHGDRDVLLVTTSDRINEARVVHVAGTSLDVGVAVPQNASSFGVSAYLPTENGVEQTDVRIGVLRPERALYVTIAPRKKRYQPGERATFDILAVGADGLPKRAEFGIGVVDQAIYAVQTADSSDPLADLYGPAMSVAGAATWNRPNEQPTPEPIATPAPAPTPDEEAAGEGTLVEPEREFMGGAGSLVRSGTTSDVYALNSAYRGLKTIAATSGAPPQIRSNFADTAYWAPSVVTGPDGRATISFVWPDNLTTWTATGLGVTQDGDVGEGLGEALVTKDFLVRLEMPRFLRAGDDSTVVGIAQGQPGSREVRLTLDPGSLETSTLPGISLRLDSNETAAQSWPVRDSGVGDTSLTLSGDDGSRNDAMRSNLPLLPATAAEHVRDAGDSVHRPSLTISVPSGYVAGAIHLSISPDMLAELVQNQRLLDVYPYYCTEQTMSAALPALFIGRVARASHLTLPGDVDSKAILRHALTRLAQLQHDDGSWGWWEKDKGHPYMTAYALYGLAEFRKDGVDVPDDMFQRGVDSLVEQMQDGNRAELAYWGGAQPGSEWNTRAFMFFALADAAPNRVDAGLLQETASHASELNPYALSALGLAEHALRNDGAARRLLAMLDARGIEDGPYLRWQGATWHYHWEDDPIETTAYALRFEAAMNADPQRIERIVDFLRSERRGDWWYTTKDTAAAIYALATAVPTIFTPNEAVRVLVDGRVVRSLLVTAPILDAADASIVVPASLVHDGSVVRFEGSGGAFYWSSDAVRYVPAAAVKAADPGTSLFARLFAAPPPLSIVRHYGVGHGGDWRVGDEVTVDVTVRAAQEVQYVAIEDPLPAGAEHVTDQGNAAEDSWSGLQFFDDRTVFFADRISPDSPLRIRYTMRVTTPGRYTAPAPSAYAMYGPPVQALGAQQKVVVEP